MWQTLLAGVLVVASVQATDRWYEGKWTAEFQGITFVRFELAVANGKPGGRISLGNVEVNADGGLRSVSPAPDRLSEIFDVAVRGAVVAFSHKDSHDIDRFEIRQVGDHAELWFLLPEQTRKELAAEGIPVPKPITLKKERSRFD